MKLPKVLFVTINNTGSGSKDDEYFNAMEDAASLAEIGGVVQVGRYELVETGTVTATPTFVPSIRKVKTSSLNAKRKAITGKVAWPSFSDTRTPIK